MKKIKIGNKEIGDIPYTIAEFGVNHNGSLERAKEAIVKAAQAGADAIKFQTYTADELVCRGTPKFWDAESKVDEGLNQHEAYKALEGFKDEWYPELIKCCEENSIEFLSTPFSIRGADFLNNLGMKAFKISSSDLSNIPLLEHIARFKKPILLSTGAAEMLEVAEAIETIRWQGNEKIIILHCTLCYPTKPEDSNLNLIDTYKKIYDFPVGISDHTIGVEPACVALASGACVLEKHYTVDKTLDKSADHWLSVDPEELKQICDFAKRLQVLRGSKDKTVFPCEAETRKYDKRSIVATKDLNVGTVITQDDITYKRPGTGIWPREKEKVVGAVVTQDIKEDEILQWDKLN